LHELLADAYVFTGRNLAFLGSANDIALAGGTRRLRWFARRRIQGQNADLTIFAVLVFFA
jgi:hypothetical protein